MTGGRFWLELSSFSIVINLEISSGRLLYFLTEEFLKTSIILPFSSLLESEGERLFLWTVIKGYLSLSKRSVNLLLTTS